MGIDRARSHVVKLPFLYHISTPAEFAKSGEIGSGRSMPSTGAVSGAELHRDVLVAVRNPQRSHGRGARSKFRCRAVGRALARPTGTAPCARRPFHLPWRAAAAWRYGGVALPGWVRRVGFLYQNPFTSTTPERVRDFGTRFYCGATKNVRFWGRRVEELRLGRYCLRQGTPKTQKRGPVPPAVGAPSEADFSVPKSL